MKINLFILVTVLSISFSSCKKEEKQVEEAPVVEQNNQFTVMVVAEAAAKDDFAVYYTEDGTVNFTDEKAVWAGIPGGSQAETLTFKLPEELVPTQIRLDFGLNKEQGNVKVSKVALEFYGKSFQFKGSDFFTYFQPNEYVTTEVDSAGGTMTILKGKGQFQTPFFYPQQTLVDEIAKITK